MRLENLIIRWWDWVIAISWQLALLIVLIAALTRCLRTASPRLRYGLWLLVLLKVVLPPSLTAPWSLGDWTVRPVVNSFVQSSSPVSLASDGSPDSPDAVENPSTGPSPRTLDPRVVVFVVWFVGVVGFLAVLARQWARIQRELRSATPIDEGPLRIALERTAISLGLKTAPELVVLRDAPGPFLTGVAKPRIVLPDDLQYDADATGLESVLAHELIHWKRHDTWTGWAQAMVQSVFWFHPLVWWANGQIRHERECACDDEVLRKTSVTPSDYSESIIQRLAASRGRASALGSVMGVLEQNSNLHFRLEQIMSYEKSRRSFGIASCALLLGCATILLPMAPRPNVEAAEEFSRTANEFAQQEAPPHPVIVSSHPKNGDLDVDPNLKTVTVTFDRDMGTGMSWTGPVPIDKTRKPAWKDARTCELPVTLQKGQAYRIGINAPSFKNFASKGGEPIPPTAIFFAVKGASADVKKKVAVPKVVSIEPANGAKDVDPALTEIKVTFDMPMSNGMSWVGGGDSFPTIAAGQKPKWSADRLSCTLPVTLKPGHTYTMGINAARFQNFQSESKVPAEPVVYTFTTRK